MSHTQDENDLAPWFPTYRHELARGLRWTDHEYFDHPVAVLLVFEIFNFNFLIFIFWDFAHLDDHAYFDCAVAVIFFLCISHM